MGRLPVAYKAAYMEQFPLLLVTILGTEEKCYSAQVAVATAITQIATSKDMSAIAI